MAMTVYYLIRNSNNFDDVSKTKRTIKCTKLQNKYIFTTGKITI